MPKLHSLNQAAVSEKREITTELTGRVRRRVRQFVSSVRRDLVKRVRETTAETCVECSLPPPGLFDPVNTQHRPPLHVTYMYTRPIHTRMYTAFVSTVTSLHSMWQLL